jgi:hypothetical protein
MGFNSGILKGTEIRMSDGLLKKVEDIVEGDKVQSYSQIEGWDNAHMRFNEVIDAEVVKISKREETHLVTTTFDNDTSLTHTLEYPYNMQHTSGSLCENPDTHGICEHAGWESYRPDLTYEYYDVGPSGSEFYDSMPPMGAGDQIWADAGKHPPRDIDLHIPENNDLWLPDWVEPVVHITHTTEITGSFEVYCIEELNPECNTIWANGVLIAAGDSFSYSNPGMYINDLTGSHEEKREYQMDLKSRIVGAASHRKLTLFQQVENWPADKGDIEEYYEKHGSLE